MVNGVDIDWFTDLNVFCEKGFIGMSTISYIGGKSVWSTINYIINHPLGHPFPFTDPGERRAVLLTELRRGYRDFITPEYLEREKP